jgi:hypothetical protein
MGVTCSSETVVNFQRTTRGYIPEDITLHNQSKSEIPWTDTNLLWDSLFSEVLSLKSLHLKDISCKMYE